MTLSALYVSLLLAGLANASHAAGATPSLAGIVRCSGERQFRIQAYADHVTIWIGRQILTLRRSPSASMTRYSSSAAALAIDGDYVVFIMNDALDFDGCHLTRQGLDDASTTM